MLVLTRMREEQVVVIDRDTGKEIGRVALVKTNGDRAVLGFEFDQRFRILRTEIQDREMEASRRGVAS